MIGKRLLSALIAFLRTMLVNSLLSLLCYILFADTIQEIINSGYLILVIFLYLFVTAFFLVFYIGFILVPFSLIRKINFGMTDFTTVLETFLPLISLTFLLSALLLLCINRFNYVDALFPIALTGIVQYTATVQFVIVIKKREFPENKTINE